MNSILTERDLAELPAGLRDQFVPLDRRAAGFAAGAWLAIGVFAVTAFHLLFDAWLLENVEALKDYTYSGDSLWLLSQYFVGYAPNTWAGALVGAAWGAGFGFVMGWTAAFVRNVVVGAWIVFVKSKARLRASREFLDQI